MRRYLPSLSDVNVTSPRPAVSLCKAARHGNAGSVVVERPNTIWSQYVAECSQEGVVKIRHESVDTVGKDEIKAARAPAVKSPSRMVDHTGAKKALG
jgi:hypothetical protein